MLPFRCRKGTAQLLVDFDNLSANIKGTDGGERGELRNYQICGKDVPHGYWVYIYISVTFNLFLSNSAYSTCSFTTSVTPITFE